MSLNFENLKLEAWGISEGEIKGDNKKTDIFYVGQ